MDTDPPRLAPIAFGIAAPLIAAAATFFGFIGGVGDPAPGQLRRAAITMAAIGIVLVAGLGLVAFRHAGAVPAGSSSRHVPRRG